MKKLALIGKGRWGTKYLEVIKNIPDWEIAYVRTRDYTDLKEKNVEGIIIATPAKTHFEIINSFPDTYLLVEKPLTTSLSETKSIKNDKIMVGHTFLYNLEYQDFKERLKSLGTISELKFSFWNTENFHSDTNVVWELAPHLISILIDLLGNEVQIKSVGQDKTTESVIVHAMVGNVRCVLDFGWKLPVKSRELVVKCERGSLTFDDSGIKSVSALEVELRAFMHFTQGEPTITSLAHAVDVATILDEIERLL